VNRKIPYVIAIDGPAGSGKSTVARELGKKLGIRYLDSGAFYRALTLFIWNLYKSLEIREEFSSWVESLEKSGKIQREPEIAISFENDETNRVFLNGVDVSREIRSPEITEKIKYIADKALFRDFVNHRIRTLAESESFVMDGRDIGTLVFPDTPYKFFLTASPGVRAERRFQELRLQNPSISREEVLEELIQRDRSDENRKIAPLQKAKDAILIDTDCLPVNVVIETILSALEGLGKS